MHSFAGAQSGLERTRAFAAQITATGFKPVQSSRADKKRTVAAQPQPKAQGVSMPQRHHMGGYRVSASVLHEQNRPKSLSVRDAPAAKDPDAAAEAWGDEGGGSKVGVLQIRLGDGCLLSSCPDLTFPIPPRRRSAAAVKKPRRRQRHPLHHPRT